MNEEFETTVTIRIVWRDNFIFFNLNDQLTLYDNDKQKRAQFLQSFWCKAAYIYFMEL